MPEGIVVQFEIIDIHHDQGQIPLAALTPLDFVIETLGELAVIIDEREGIRDGQKTELFIKLHVLDGYSHLPRERAEDPQVNLIEILGLMFVGDIDDPDQFVFHDERDTDERAAQIIQFACPFETFVILDVFDQDGHTGLRHKTGHGFSQFHPAFLDDSFLHPYGSLDQKLSAAFIQQHERASACLQDRRCPFHDEFHQRIIVTDEADILIKTQNLLQLTLLRHQRLFQHSFLCHIPDDPLRAYNLSLIVIDMIACDRQNHFCSIRLFVPGFKFTRRSCRAHCIQKDFFLLCIREQYLDEIQTHDPLFDVIAEHSRKGVIDINQFPLGLRQKNPALHSLDQTPVHVLGFRIHQIDFFLAGDNPTHLSHFPFVSPSKV